MSRVSDFKSQISDFRFPIVPRQSSGPLLEADHLTCGYGGEPVLHGITLALPQGGFWGVLGPNGSGKSTLVRALSGTLPPQTGEVRWEGVSLSRLSRRELARRMAVVPQAAPPLFAFSGWDWVQMGRHPHLRRFQPLSDRDRAVVIWALAQTDTLHLADRPVNAVSGGELQRLVLAQALAQEPEVLLLDEPTAHLDLHHQSRVFDLLRELNANYGLTILCISHDVNLAAEYCDHLLLLRQGRIVAEGPPEEVITEATVQQVYDTPVQVAPHPISGRPQVTLLPRPKTPRSVPAAAPSPQPLVEEARPAEDGMVVSSPRLAWGWLPLLLLLLLAAAGVALRIGPVSLSWSQVMHTLLLPAPTPERTIVWSLRLPRLLLAAQVGAALALAGTVMQAFFQNPMASPYIMGVSAGAGLGAVVAFLSGVQQTFFGLTATSLLAFGGGLVVTAVVYLLSRRGGRVATETLLLTGLAVGTLLTALTSFLMLLGAYDLHGVLFWLMGSLSGRGWMHVAAMLPYAVLGTAAALVLSRDLNLLLLGEETAAHLGLNVERAKQILLALTAVLTAASVAVSGLIGFVGLLVPHVTRLLVGPDHRLLLPAAALSGGTLLVLADTVARTAITGEIPLGILTSLLGGPFFLYLLRRERR